MNLGFNKTGTTWDQEVMNPSVMYEALLSLNLQLFPWVGVHYEANDWWIGTNHPRGNPFIRHHRNSLGE